MNPPNSVSRQVATQLVHEGRPVGAKVTVNPVVARTSTVVFDSMQTLRAAVTARSRHERGLLYGRKGSSTGDALEDVVATLEGGFRARLFGSGLAAITCAILSVVKAGDHVLVVDSCYEPVRKFCAQYLSHMGVTHDFFRADLSDLAGKITPQTRLIWTECPGSVLYEMCDLPALVALARQHENIVVAVDNTWGSGLMYQPLAHGADMSIIAATKYLVGHSDVMMGVVTTSESAWPGLNSVADLLGHSVSPDDAYLALRGSRTLLVRMERQQSSALALAQALQQHPLVATVFCPALPDDPGHALWKRDFSGGNGLLSIEFIAEVDSGMVDRFVESLGLFSLGHSWGGYESLALPMQPSSLLDEETSRSRGRIVRLHAGLEDPGDLIADLEQALERLSHMVDAERR